MNAFGTGDLAEVLELFEDRTFYYRSYRPDLLAEQQIADLLGPADLCCRIGPRLAGLFAADPLPAGYSGHHQVHMRFAPWVPGPVAARLVRRLIAGLADRTPVRRLTHLVPGFDERGRTLAADSGFRDEGALAGLLSERGRRLPVHYFALLRPDYPVHTRISA